MGENRKEGPVLTEHTTQDALGSDEKRAVEMKFRITYFVFYGGETKQYKQVMENSFILNTR